MYSTYFYWYMFSPRTFWTHYCWLNCALLQIIAHSWYAELKFSGSLHPNCNVWILSRWLCSAKSQDPSLNDQKIILDKKKLHDLLCLSFTVKQSDWEAETCLQIILHQWLLPLGSLACLFFSSVLQVLAWRKTYIVDTEWFFLFCFFVEPVIGAHLAKK